MTDPFASAGKARNQLSRACGAESEHYKQFQASEDVNPLLKNTHDFMQTLREVFAAAKEDFEGGHVRSIRSFVHAELFDDELEQATELLASGYTRAAAVVARVVLETTLRTLCGDCNPVIEVRMPDGKSMKLDKLNADLAKDGAYDKLTQKEVTCTALFALLKLCFERLRAAKILRGKRGYLTDVP